MKQLILIFSLIILTISQLWAQSNVEMADTMRSNGKIYVVVAVLGIVLLGILIYLILLDKKISKLEKDLKG